MGQRMSVRVIEFLHFYLLSPLLGLSLRAVQASSNLSYAPTAVAAAIVVVFGGLSAPAVEKECRCPLRSVRRASSRRMLLMVS